MIATAGTPLATLRNVIRLPAAADPEVSVIVLLDGTVEMAERSLRAIAGGGEGPVPFETVIVLNDPDAALEDLVRRGTAGAKAVLTRANAGPGVGWNLGASVADAPRLMTLHEDSEPDAGWLTPLCETMTETGAGAVGSRLYDRDGSVQNCGWVLCSDGSPHQIDELSAPEVVAGSDPTPADVISGAAMLVDREAMRAAGGWDERFYPAVFMDIDMSTAIWNQGRLVLSVPASGVRHGGGTLRNRAGSALTGHVLGAFLFERHRVPFLSKWGAAVRSLAPPPADAEPESVRAAVRAALRLTAERAELVRSGGWRPPGPPASARRPFTGIAEPVVGGGEGAHAAAGEVEAALREAEARAVDDYCRWLVDREEGQAADLHEARLQIQRDARELARLHARAEAVQAHSQALALELDRVAHSLTWRLRTMLRRALLAPGALLRSARRGPPS